MIDKIWDDYKSAGVNGVIWIEIGWIIIVVNFKKGCVLSNDWLQSYNKKIMPQKYEITLK